MNNSVEIGHHGEVTVVTLNRPEVRNAVEADAYFGVYCRRFGVPLIDGGTVRLPRLIGMGLCNRVVPTGQALHQEWERGKGCLDDGVEGAARFAGGVGRHGVF